MTAPTDNRPPARRFAFRWARFIAVALVLVAVGIASVDALRPEFRFQAIETVAEIQIRVVPKLAPTSEALEKRILGAEYLTAVWKDSLPDDADSSSEVRDAELAEWRSRLRVILGEETIGSSRSIRVVWSGLDDMELGALVVESLARRYADEVSADRWYGSVDRLRAKVKAVERSTQDLLDVARRTSEQNRAVSALDSEPESAPQPITKVTQADLLSAAIPLGAGRQNPVDDRYRELVDRRARLVATMQPNHPELQAVEAALAATAAELRRAPTVVLTGATTAEPDANEGPSLLIAPETANPMAGPVPKKMIPAIPKKRIASQVSASPDLDEATRRVNAASRELQSQMDDMLLPREAEFPVVTLDRIGLRIWHLRPIWYAGVALLSVLLAAAISITKRAEVPRASQAASVASSGATGILPVSESVDHATSAVATESPASVKGSPVVDSLEAESASRLDRDAVFHTAAEVEAKLAAPVLAVLTRRRSTTAGDAQQPLRRVA
jgi:hypothetical protein